MDLYVATRSDDDSIVKIGKSSNVLARCAQLQRGHSFKFYVNAILEGKGACEKTAHEALKGYRFGKTERFEIDVETALGTIQECELKETRQTRAYDLETIAKRNLERGKTLKSTRYSMKFYSCVK